MSEVYKILGQLNPSQTIGTLYTVPANTSAVVSTVAVCNTTDSSSAFRIYVVPSGQTYATLRATHFGIPIPANDTFQTTAGYTLATGDSIQVYASISGTVFSAYGSEIS